MLKRIVDKVRDAVSSAYYTNPARANGAIVGVVTAAAAAVGFVVSAPAVLGVVAVLAPILVAELTRAKVFAPATVDKLVTRGVSVAVEEDPRLEPPLDPGVGDE